MGFSLCACTSVEPLRPDIAARVMPSRLDEIAYINALRDAFEFSDPRGTGCYDGTNLRYFRPELEQGYPDHNVEQETVSAARAPCVKYKKLTGDTDGPIKTYLEAGFGLTDLYCQRYFAIATESAQKRKFQRSTGSTVDTLVNAILGVANAGETALAVANAGFEAYGSTYQNIEDAFTVSPELENVRKLVHAAQQDFRTSAFNAMPGSYEGARSVVERYAGLCSYTGMKQLVNDSVTSETRALAAQAQERTDDDDDGNAAVSSDETNEESNPTDATVAVPASPES